MSVWIRTGCVTAALLVCAGLFEYEGGLAGGGQSAPAAQDPASPQPAARGDQPSAQTSPMARGRGGRGNPIALMYTERCAACHGTETVPGRAANLFDDQWVRAKDDVGIAAVVAEGIPQTEMVPFKQVLSDTEIWNIVAYLRLAGANAKPRPVAVQDPDGQVITSEKATFRMEVLAREIETPWGLAFLPDGRLLVTERGGRLRIIQPGKPEVLTVTGTPKVWERQDAGLFDVEVHPQYSKTGWIYLAYAEPLANYTPPPPPPAGDTPPPGRGGRGPQTPGIPSMTTIVRGRIGPGNQWTEQQFIYHAPSELYTLNNSHFGSRFTFDRQGHLFYTIGERGVVMDAQDLGKPTGKIHRVNDDGSVPKDNPFVGREGALPTIWSYGHRNPQGLAWNPVDGKLWASEHGPQGGDEINIIEPGQNYGWGVVTMGIQSGITKRTAPGMVDPVVYFTPTIAPSGMVFYTGDRYPGWKNNLLVGALAGQQLRRLEISNDTVTHQEVVFNKFGRVRDIVQGPDGYLYVALQMPGQVLSAPTMGTVARLVPVAK
jgi:glucose/arabinose dehydrogenase